MRVSAEAEKTCRGCPGSGACRDSAASWVFLFIGLLATIAIRAVNVVMDLSAFWAKAAWYVGVAGFLVYFLYKFRQDRSTQKALLKSGVASRLVRKEALLETDYEFLSSTICRLRSAKDAINYFFIFLTSFIALAVGVYQDFLRR